MSVIRNILLFSSSLLFTAGCASHTADTKSAQPLPPVTQETPPTPAPPSTAELNGRKGSKAHGTIIFTDEGKTVHVVGEFAGLKPNSVHGLHVHENGSCDGAKFEGAGAHYNPSSMQHGGPDSDIRHAGDLGNIKADKKGHAKIDIRIPQGPGIETFGGKSVILHAKKDDLKSQPSGNSGDKIACGLIVQQK